MFQIYKMNLEKEFIKNEASNLPIDDRLIILQIIAKHDIELIQTFPDGSRINLDRLPENVILLLYNRIKYMLDNN